MSRLTSLVAALPRALNTNPQPLPAITLSRTLGAVFVLRNYMLTSNAAVGPALNLDVRSYTLSTLATAINAVSGYSASVVAAGNIGAYSLLDGTYDGTGGISTTIPYFTSNTYRVMAPIAATMQEIDEVWAAGLNQADLRHAETVWVDRWGLLYGITRSLNETDATYARRIVFSAVQAKTNNSSIAIILQQALGIAMATVTETAIPSLFTINLTLSDTGSTVYDTGAINGFIKLYKALGTLGVLSLASSGVEAYATTTTPVDTLIDTFQAPTGEWGGPEFAIREHAL